MKYLEPDSSAKNPQDFQHQSPPSDSMLAREGDRQQLHALLGKLNVDEADLANSDAIQEFRLRSVLSLESQERAVALIKSPQIANWVTSTTSAVLHVNGQMLSSEHEARQSSLSFVCAKVAASVIMQNRTSSKKAINPPVVLRWFCSQHTNARTDSHVHGMLKGLLSQFVHQLLSLNIGITSTQLPTLGHDPTLSEMCDIMVELAQSMPQWSMLFCIIDDVSCYEDAQRWEALTEVLLMLKSLKDQNYEAARRLVKILTTAPLNSSLVSTLFDDDEVFTMNKYYPPNGGFSAFDG